MTEHRAVLLVARRLPLVVLVLAWVSGCSLDRGGLERHRSAIDAGSPTDAATGCPAVACPSGRACVRGACVDPSTDRDGDGVPASMDCDDMNAGVGSAAERVCSTACATGVERCSGGVWAPCDAPAACTCTPGATRSVSCPMCGTQAQRCGPMGTWLDEGPCAGAGECAPGTSDSAGTCGMCGTLRRDCSATCAWGGATCVDEGECVAGATASEDGACGVCGAVQTRTRACDPMCRWGVWSAWSACSMPSITCTPGEVQPESQSCGCGSRGTQTHQRTCDPTCTWGAWGGWGGCTGDGHCRTIAGTDVCPGWTGGCYRCGTDGGWDWIC